MMAKQTPQKALTPLQPPAVSKSSTTNRARSERLEYWVRAHNPTNDPPFSRWDAVGLFVVIVLFLGQQHTPGLLTDLGTYAVAGWEWGIYARLTPLLLACLALFAVRAMHPITRVYLYGQVVYLCMRIAETRITHEPLTIVFTLLLVLFSISNIRVIIRPNEFELAQQAAQKEEETHGL